MTIDKLSRLFDALGQSSGGSYSKQNSKVSSEQPEGARDEAVSFSSTFGSSGTGAESSTVRSARVEEIKRAVNNGSYQTDRNAVAESVARELIY